MPAIAAVISRTVIGTPGTSWECSPTSDDDRGRESMQTIRMNMAVLGDIGQHFANAGRVRAARVYRTHQQADGSDKQQQTTSKMAKRRKIMNDR